jgi:acyl carrier protein
MTTTLALEDTLRAFVAGAAGVHPADNRDDTPLIASGILSSLQAIDLIAHVEAVTGLLVDVTRLRPGTFRDITTLAAGLRSAQRPAVTPTRDRVRDRADVAPRLPSRAALGAMQRIDALIVEGSGAPDERHSPLVDLEVLRRIGWVASFPQLLMLASPLRRDDGVLRRVGAAPASLAAADLAPPECALTPAACIPALAARAGARLSATLTLTTQATCFRHEASTRPGVRLRAFSMREVACVGAPDEVRAFRESWAQRGLALARVLGLDAELVVASDPFFDPAHDPHALAQRMDEPIKLELVHDGTALASFNLHRGFFARAHDISLEHAPCWSACAAFGLERWAWAMGRLEGQPDWQAAASALA